jgi:hypothetical protein
MSTPRPRSSPVLALLSLAVLFVAAVFGLAWTNPPTPRTPALAAGFSMDRASADLRALASRPRRMGSADHARARDYLVAELEKLGLAPEIQETVARGRRRDVELARVMNVIGRREGTGSGKALLLMAHYDTRSMTPGASDDGYGVVALLEAARALANEAPLASDVIFLFTDGEETGLFGARAFADEHPRAKDVGLVLNFEARGGAGPVLLFQTSESSGALVRQAIHAAERPVASSLMEAVYKRLPNDTDLTVWLGRGAAGLNFANIGGFERYHAPSDTVENADLATLAHHASYAITLARAFGASKLPIPLAPASTYFNIGPLCVVYAGSFNVPLVSLASALFVGFVVIARRRRDVRLGGVVSGFVVVLGTVVTAAMLGGVLLALAGALDADFGALAHIVRPAKKQWFVAAISFVSAAVVFAAATLGVRRVRPLELYAGGALLLVLLAVATTIVLPGGAFLFTWPALASLVFGTALVASRRAERDDTLAIVLSALAAAPAIVILGPHVPMLFSAFGPAAAPLSAAVFALAAATSSLALRPLVDGRVRRWILPLGSALAALVSFVVTILVSPFDARAPRPSMLIFATDRGDGSGPPASFWLSPAPAPDAYTAPALAKATEKPSSALPFPLPLRNVLVADAPPSAEPGPEIVWQDELPGGSSRLGLSVVPPKGAELVFVEVSGISSATVADRPTSVAGGRLTLRFWAPPPSGIAMVVTRKGSSQVVVRALSQRTGFPEDVASILGPRPADLAPKPGTVEPWDELWESEMTLVGRVGVR